ncbi:MAG TPA: hypothetical protein VM008_19720 [Phycisphaerae bacterium]|nr:hypothetical protein [Phycisphaerae bacterium]
MQPRAIELRHRLDGLRNDRKAADEEEVHPASAHRELRRGIDEHRNFWRVIASDTLVSSVKAIRLGGAVIAARF